MRAAKILKLLEEMAMEFDFSEEEKERMKQKMLSELRNVFKRYSMNNVEVTDIEYDDKTVDVTIKDREGNTDVVVFSYDNKTAMAEVGSEQIPLSRLAFSVVTHNDKHYLNLVEPSWLNKMVISKILASSKLNYEEKELKKLSYDAYGNILMKTE